MLAVGRYHSGALVGGEILMWGGNSSGQLGDGTGAGANAPSAIGLGRIQKLALGETFSCALTDSNELLCWGDASAGQLGDGTTVSRSVPAPVIWP
jgi:alpha-tubulin suppressor-like RCC1 family protein